MTQGKSGFCPHARLRQHQPASEVDIGRRRGGSAQRSCWHDFLDWGAKHVITYHREQRLGHADALVVSAVLSAKKSATRASLFAAAGVHVQAMCVKLAQLLGEGGAEKLKAAALRFALVEEWPASGSEVRPPPALAVDDVLVPKLMGYDEDGKAADAQDEIRIQK